MPTREATIRDYRERLNRAIFHVERNLDAALSLDELAGVACFSPFHFHRIFAAFTGERPADFVRRLRLERAATSLLHLDEPITEIGLAAGYQTPSAFGRAFATRFGMTPSEYRKRSEPARLLGARPLELSKGQEEPMMKPDIRAIDPIPVIFARRTGPYAEAAAGAFAAVCGFAGPRGLFGPATRMIGISHDDPHVTEAAKFRYDACVTVDRDVKPEGEIGAKAIAGGRYVVFLHAGPYEGFQGTYDEIFGKWLPASGEQLREEPCFEVYLTDPARCRPEEMRTEIWIPIA